MKDRERISRRDFLKYGVVAGAAAYGLAYLGKRTWPRKLKQDKDHDLRPGLAVARGDDPVALTEKAIAALGGMNRLVSRGDVVVIKPNMAWSVEPRFAANTNPEVVAALVRLCREAGAKKVKVFDNTCSTDPSAAYDASGIASAARAAGADVHFARRDGYVERAIPDGVAIKSWLFYEEIIYADECDVLINVPIAKHHSTSRLSLGLKNVFGMVGGERGDLHPDIHRKIADLNRVIRTDLTVLDAFRVLRRHGPTGGRLEDVDETPDGARRVVASTDRVAVDAYGASLFGLKAEDLGFLRACQEAQLGEADLEKVQVVAV